jgi:hypothetical protein
MKPRDFGPGNKDAFYYPAMPRQHESESCVPRGSGQISDSSAGQLAEHGPKDSKLPDLSEPPLPSAVYLLCALHKGGDLCDGCYKGLGLPL